MPTPACPRPEQRSRAEGGTLHASSALKNNTVLFTMSSSPDKREVRVFISSTFRDLYRESEFVIIPKIYRQATTTRVLVMQFFEGFRVTEVDEIVRLCSPVPRG